MYHVLQAIFAVSNTLTYFCDPNDVIDYIVIVFMCFKVIDFFISYYFDDWLQHSKNYVYAVCIYLP